MRREDIFMDIIGELDDRYIELAMPLPGNRAKAADVRGLTVVQPARVSKKELRRYYITHAIGIAAVAALITGAAVWLWRNWDRIAVREPDRPGVSTAIYRPEDDKLPDISEAYGRTIEFGSASVGLSKLSYDGTSLNAAFNLLYSGSDDVPYPALWINVEGEECEPSCSAQPAAEADSYNYLVYSFVRVKLEPGRTYTVNVEYNADGVRESDTQKYSFTCPDITASTTVSTTNDPYLTSAVEALADPSEADPFGQITDTSMPEPYPYNDPEHYSAFYSQWTNRFTTVSNRLTELPDKEKADEPMEYYTLCRAETPYTLDDNFNLYSWMTRLDLSADDVCGAIEENNEYYRTLDNAGDMIFNPYETDKLRAGDRYWIAEAFATEYTVIVGENVFCPQWLYYHTIEDYKAAGIRPETILQNMTMYEGLGLTDEAWEAFGAKLRSYADTADRLSQITDTSMPRPFPIEQDYDHMSFESQWKTKFIGIFGDRDREGYNEQQQYLMTVRTPYTLYDNNCIAGDIKALGYTAAEIEEKIGTHNEKWQERLRSAEENKNEGAIMNCREMIFSEEEINALVSGDEAAIIPLFISDCSIWVRENDYVISPKWLYYHTAEDYRAAGVTPEMIVEKLPLYEDAFIGGGLGNDMAEESWAAFTAKLDQYIIGGEKLPEDMLGEWSVTDVASNAFSQFTEAELEHLDKMLDDLGNEEAAALYRQAYALRTLTERDYEDLSNDSLLKNYYGDDYQDDSRRAAILFIDGKRYAGCSGFLWDSFVSGYKSVFTEDYADELIADLPCVHRYGRELYYSGVTSTMRAMIYPEYTVPKNTDDEIIIRETCYNIDYETRKPTDEVRYVNDMRFVKTSGGWRCAYFGVTDKPQ
ncbi:MAG: hypothetical protein IJT87_10200 [Ruminiclostridium sp.]|nr:hypothetical protein [Ruminiclostridium sp.]